MLRLCVSMLTNKHRLTVKQKITIIECIHIIAASLLYSFILSGNFSILSYFSWRSILLVKNTDKIPTKVRRKLLEKFSKAID